MTLVRVNVSLDPAVHAALTASAKQRGMRVTTLAGQIITSGLLGDAPGPPGLIPLPTTTTTTTAVPDPAPPSGAAAAPTVPAVAEQERAHWLQLDRGRGWRAHMWQLGEQLRADYPDLAENTKNGWTADAFTRDGLLSYHSRSGASNSTPAPSPTRASSINGSRRLATSSGCSPTAPGSSARPLPAERPDGW